MKCKISISVDDELIEIVKKLLEDGRFRNKSHIFEYALKRFIRGEN